MITISGHYDVAVVGAGTAGAATAALCAERGLRVLCIDRRRLDNAGARWVNGVAASAFIKAGIPLPRGDELRGRETDKFHLIAGWGPERLDVTDHGVLEVDMRHLVTRLQTRARAAGATLVDDTRVHGYDGHRLHTDRGAVDATFLVDASGLGGARLLDQPKVHAHHICAAAQQVRRVRDAQAARAFCDRHRVSLSDVLCFTGVAGGFSIVNVRTDGERVSILTGTIPAAGFPSGKALLDRFVAANAWIGEPIFGGARAIPLRRPFDRLADDRIALIGDAGCQVFAAHGSGIGVGLIAARMLADALSSGRGPRAYATAWQRQHGGLLAAYDLFRRFSQTLTVDELRRMMRRGVVDTRSARAGMAQQLPRIALSALPTKLASLAREPRLSARLARTAVRIPAILALYRRYPDDHTRLPRWSRAIARVSGDLPDDSRVSNVRSERIGGRSR